MLDPRWRKVLRDAWLHKARTLLVVLAIAVGITGAGTILNTWALVQVATREGFLASNPPAATLRTDSVDEALLARVRSIPGISDAEARRTVMASAQVQGAWRSTAMFAMDDFSAARIGVLRPEVGQWPPEDGAFVIERSSVDFSGASVGAPLNILIGRGDPQTLAVTGIARDVGLAPGWMEHVIYGFVTRATLAQLGAPSTLNEVRITLSDPAFTHEDARRSAWQVKDVIERTGQLVDDIDVPTPRQHIHAAQMDSLLYTQGAFGVLALFVCAFLVVNLVTAMLAGQVREIGVMKTIGAQPRQIASMYLVFALMLGLLASAMALPAAAYIGREYAALKAELLNFTVEGFSIPAWVIALQVIVGGLLPVAAAAIPVTRGCRLPVAAALRDFGIDDRAGTPALTGLLGRVGGVSRPILLSVRNASRKRQRMILTFLALATGGAVYLGAQNLRASVIGSLDLLFGSQRYDFVLRFSEPHAADSIERAVRVLPGVSGAEAWGSARAVVSRGDATTGNAFTITAPPAGTQLLVPTVTRGRWLDAADTSALVVNGSMMKVDPSLQPGSETSLAIAGRQSVWQIVGVVESGAAPVAFATREAIARVTGESRVSAAVVKSAAGGVASQVGLIQALRRELDRTGLQVASSQLLAESRRVTEDHLLTVVQFLGVMGWVMILVGGMGLASTMSLAVLERTREIGVLRAIGARHTSIMAMIQVEGLVIALASWVVALPLSLPMSIALGEAFSRMMLRLPVSYVPEASGVVRWLGVVLIVSIVACAWPAIRATRSTIASALSYG